MEIQSTFSALPISILLGSIIIILFFSDYFRKRRSEIQSLTTGTPEIQSALVQKSKKSTTTQSISKKLHSKSHASDKEQSKKHHPLDVNTLKGHGDSVTALCFSPDGRSLATACADGVLRVFKLEDASSKSFKFLRINLPAGGQPTAISFSDEKSSLAVAVHTLFGSSLYMYGEGNAKPESEGKQQLKLPLPEIKWEHHKVHDKRVILTLVWEIVYSKDGSVKEVTKAMQLKGHKSAVTWLCFTPSSEQMVTASKDGSIRIWNINVRYHLDEDPKTLKVFPIPLHDANGSPLHYDRLSVSPNGRILVATHGTTLQWLCMETGKVLDTAEKAHEGDITGIAWAPRTVPLEGAKAMVLATCGTDKKVKLWVSPTIQQS
ncbi:hypothetical protein ACHQM5_001169 [Ranunculus cassubicifolius]